MTPYLDKNAPYLDKVLKAFRFFKLMSTLTLTLVAEIYVSRDADDESVLSTALDAEFSPPAKPPANGQSFYQTDPERFIIPLLSMGPNNQLEGFLESVFLAIKLNR